jgi:ribokinase
VAAPRLLVVGSANMDLVVRAPHIPRPGETLSGSDFVTVPGGKGSNQAVAAARLGAEVCFAGRVGNDPFGKHLARGLAENGVNTDHLGSDETAPTGIAMIIVDEAGENSIVVAPGANHRIRPDAIDKLKPLIETVDFLVLQLEIPVETVDRALETARACGVRSLLDAGPAKALPPDVLRKADIVSPNESETEALTGCAVTDIESARRAAGSLLGMGVATVVLKLGANGAFIASDTVTAHVPAFEIQPVDTTAAGDGFTAALAVALAEGKEIESAVRFANAAGALAALEYGAQPSMPTRSAVESFLEERS